eukprot:6429655-Alexandrium_andersonii.AAC.1
MWSQRALARRSAGADAAPPSATAAAIAPSAARGMPESLLQARTPFSWAAPALHHSACARAWL